MKCTEFREVSESIKESFSSGLSKQNRLLLIFASRAYLESGLDQSVLGSLDKDCTIVGCSTAGEIVGTELIDEPRVAASLIEFEKTEITVKAARSTVNEDVVEVGGRLAQELQGSGLKHTYLIAHGNGLNGSDLCRGLCTALPDGVSATGGLAGDDGRFEKTLILNGTEVRDDLVIAIGFYGDALRVGYGSIGGWQEFGTPREITKSDGNVLYELDGEPALELYKRYLGSHAAELPASGLLFPLSIRRQGASETVIRTLLDVDEDNGTMTFAGDVPEGAQASLMRGQYDKLIQGSKEAAKNSIETGGIVDPDLVVLVTCIGRKMVLNQRVEEELEVVADVVGADAFMTGFYSYGEIAPPSLGGDSALHNQTMTVTVFKE